MVDEVLAFLTASVLLTISPGPDIIYVLVQGVTRGKKYGVITALGLVTGIIIHTSFVAFGISALIRQSESIFLGLKIMGAAYLLYLAYQVYKSEDQILPQTQEKASRKGLWSLFKTGFLMNVLNPKVAIFFVAFFPGFLWDPKGNAVLQFYTLGLLFMLQAFVIFALVAVMAGKISVYLQRHPHAGKIFKWVQVCVFLGIAIFILW